MDTGLAQINSAGCTYDYTLYSIIRKEKRKSSQEKGNGNWQKGTGRLGSSSRGEPDAKHITLRHRRNKLSGSLEIEEKKKGESNDNVQYSCNIVKYVQ